MTKFIATIRGTDDHRVHLCPEGFPEKWAAGNTLQEAMQDLRRTFPEYSMEISLDKIEWNRADSYTWVILTQTRFG